MTDLHDLRAQLREARASSAAVAGGGFRIPFGVVAGAAVVAGFLLVMFMPKIYSVQRTAALPVFKEARVHAEELAQAAAPTAAVSPAAPARAAGPASASPGSAPISPAAPTPMSSAAPNYAGKSTRDVIAIANAVCEHRATAAPQKGQAAVEAKLQCFLTEGTPRFCAPGQARKATADIINYFKGIEYTNAALGVAAKLPFRNPANDAQAQPPTMLTPEPRVVEAVEGLLRAGYISKGNREEILANVPRDYRARFAPIVGLKAPCPEPPWWAVWK
jgi:hypothetical protein